MKQQIKEKGIAHPGVIIAVVIVVAAIALGGWYVWNKNKDDKGTNKSNNSSQSQQNEKQNGEHEFVVPEGWKLYKNNEAGFSFYYPPDWGEVEKSDVKYKFSALSGASFQANRRDKQHDPVEFGIRDNNIIDVSTKDGSTFITYLTGTDPSTKEKVVPSGDVVKSLPGSHACVTDEVNLSDFVGDPDVANTHVYLGYCGLVSSTFGAFTFNSNGQDATTSKAQELKEDIVKLLQTFETF